MFIETDRGNRWLTQNDTCRVSISIESMNFQGERLSLLIGWISDRFRACHIVLADLLQRDRTDFRTISPTENQIATQRGDGWLTANRAILETSKVPLTISRWATWLAHPKYLDFLSRIEGAYLSNKEFEEAVDLDVLSYTRRKFSSCSDQDVIRSRMYIIEELAVIVLYELEQVAVEVYPGSQLRSHKFLARYGEKVGIPHVERSRFIKLRFRSDRGNSRVSENAAGELDSHV